MATSRRTATNENISTFGGAGQGRDYTDVQTWAGDTEIDLVTATQSEVLECYDDAASFNQKIVVEAATTNASYFRIVRPAAGEGHDGTSNNGVFFDISGVGGDAWRLDEAYSSFQDIIVKATLNDASPRSVFDIREANNLIVGLIAFDSSNIGAGVLIAGFEMTEDQIAVNCLAENCAARGFDVDAPTDTYLYNCCAIGNGTTGFFNDVNGTFVNCLGDNNTVNDFSGSPAGNNNASSDGTATGTGSRTNQTFTFINAAGNDFHLSINDAGAREYGADLSADGVFAFDDDIDGRVRAWTWDIGFDEYFSPYPIMSNIEADALVFGNRIVR
jgi:hypothetical protein